MSSVESMKTQRQRAEFKSNTSINDIIIEESYKAIQYFGNNDRGADRL
jgi:hypothetical protein